MKTMNQLSIRRFGVIALLLTLCLSLLSCQLVELPVLPTGTAEATPEVTLAPSTEAHTGTESTNKQPEETPTVPDATGSVPPVTSAPPQTDGPQVDSPESLPTYTGSPYCKLNNNIPLFTEEEITTKAYETYHPLDSLGRCTLVEACLGRELMPTGDRGSISSVRPTGWHGGVTYPGLNTDSLYNRCHLIAWSLSGENANKENLVTGTRYMNESGMLPFENMVLDYIRETGNHVMYRVTPIFIGDELLCRGVIMEAYSVEDRGDGISFHVYCFNVQPGIILDYATGDSRMDDAATGEIEDVPAGATYIINKKSKKYHRLDSKYYGNLTSNMEYTTLSKAELEAMGYDPCGTCKP